MSTCPSCGVIQGVDFDPSNHWPACERRGATAETVVRCRCVWHGVACAKEATQEDGLCDWCGPRRPEDLRSNPFAMFADDGEYLGLAGGTVTGYNHQAGWDGIPDSVRPTACWMEPQESGPPTSRDADTPPNADLGPHPQNHEPQNVKGARP